MRKNRQAMSLIAMFMSFCAIILSGSTRVVVLEKGTGTWCQYCPGAAKGFEDLKASLGDKIVCISYHGSDAPYSTTESAARISYYNLSGYPTAWFDGLNGISGGYTCSDGSSMYSEYLPNVNARLAISSPLTISLSSSCPSSAGTATIIITNTSASSVTGTLQALVLERHISKSWQGCMTEVDFCMRDMLPDQNGEAITLAAGASVTKTRTFTIASGWVKANCRVAAFVQASNKEIYQGAVCDVNTTIDNPPVANFTNAQTPGTLTIVYTDGSTDDKGVSAWLWNFGDGATSTVKNPSRTYVAAGTFTVSLKVTDTIGQTNTKTTPVVVNPIGVGKELFVACFSGAGIWVYDPNTGAWTQWNSADASLLAVGDIDGNGKEDLAGVYGAAGIWIRYDSGTWGKVNVSGNPVALAVGDVDGNGKHELVGVWTGIGDWAYNISTNTWTKILDKDAKQISSGDYDKDGKDEILGWWSPEGLWVYDVADTKWTKVLDETNLVQIATGDMNGDGRDDGLGIWTHGVWYYDLATNGWTRLYDTANKISAGDLDGGGKDDLIGIWDSVPGIWARYTETGTWFKIHDTKPACFAAGKLK